MKHKDYYVNIGLKILYYRRKNGLTQEQLADKMFFSKNQLQRVETAYAQPSLEFLFEVADALEINVKDLFDF